MQLSKAGVEMERISALLRHTNASITKKHYAEPDMGALKKIVDNVRAMRRFAFHLHPICTGCF